MPVITDVQQATPAWLSERLRAAGCLSGAVSEVQVLDSAQTNVSRVYHLTLRYTAGSDVQHAPLRLFLKLPSPQLTWADKEIDFYARIAPAMAAGDSSGEALPFLRCYDAAFDPESGASHLLLADLSATHYAFDGPVPLSLDLCRRVIDAFARLHAFWWEHPRLGLDIGWRVTPEDIAGFLQTAQERLRALCDALGDGLGTEQRRILEEVVRAWPARRRERLLAGRGITLVHRDPHPRNFLYPNDPDKDAVKLIDWQSWRVDTGSDDLAYMMACHWPSEQRAALETDLLRRYHEQLGALGVRGYTWEDCWYDYRASVIRCLFFLTGAWSERQGASWTERMARGLQAYSELGCGELLG